MSINWESSYSVGVSLIDEQHKVFFKLLDELSSAYYSLKTSDILGKIFKELFDYANYHFDTEERYFEEFKYEESEAHIAEHKNYIKRLGEIQVRIKDDETKAALELIDFMENWMIHHIGVMDKRYVECFHKNGLN